MSFFNIFDSLVESRNNKKREIEERRAGYGGIGALMFGGGRAYSTDRALLISTVYRCVSLLSDSVASLPLEVFKIDSKGYRKKYLKHPAFEILSCQPNQRMTRYTFIKLLISSMLLRGNAYAYIVRDEKGDVKELLYLPPEYVSIIPPRYLYEPVTYRVTGFDFEVTADSMLHIVNETLDGVTGVSTLTYARNTLEIAANSEEHARNFFGGGCAVSGILKVQANLTGKQKNDIKSSWTQAFNSKTGQTNGLAVLEGNMDYQPISISSKDAQFLESRQYSVVEICRFFGVNPTLAFDLSHSNYSTVEAANLSFLSQTLSPLLSKLELEFKRKIFKEHANIDVRFDVSALLRTDKASQSDYYQKMILNGVMSVNEVRRELNLIPVEGGDVNFIAANLLSLKACASNMPANSMIRPEKQEEKPTEANDNAPDPVNEEVNTEDNSSDEVKA